MPFTIEGETASGEYFVVEGIDTFQDVQEWMEFLDEEYGVVETEWDYEGA